ncbi:PBECR4 domain-containing protein [uncultured Oscillibacter sp.]|uniref:PBECR4 domain-containing protein n=1 Tax=uncultured Oscillibacter sp. TaxID=876091 RepID=UPI0028052286|nr:PBECR4 domain-containing protein [uncultured Oscillibacter sp.]
MDTKDTKKEQIRAGIVSAAQSYSAHLTNRVFLYVFGEEYIEVMFRADDFLHLTGVDTRLFAKDFYSISRKAQLGLSQFFFKQQHPFELVKKKIPCLMRLHELTNRDVIILKDLSTGSLVYKIALTNLEFTIGMYEKDGMYSPQTLRVKDKTVERSAQGEVVDFIFERQYNEPKYKTCTFSDPAKTIPDCVRDMLELDATGDGDST